jgi:cell division protein FtsZ
MTDNILKGLSLDDVTRSIIMVAGVGGAGGNALNHMIDLGINDVTFMACNTDAQALDQNRASTKIQLGSGLGAGNKPEKGSQAAKESVDDIINVFRSEGIKMLFITAGMGGGTGTGASPIIAKAAQELDILTVAIVTTPFTNEGPVRAEQARRGIEELRQYTDSLLVLSNDSIEELYGDLPYDEGFAKADDVLATAVKGIAEIITGQGTVNVDFADVNTVMRGSGRAFMGSARAEGANRAAQAVEEAVSSLLLNYRDITGAKDILLNISYGERTVTGREAGYVREYLQERTGYKTNLIWGTAYKPSLGEELELTIVATGFEGEAGDAISVPKYETKYEPKPIPESETLAGFARPQPKPTYEPKQRVAQPAQPQSGVVQWKGVDRYSDIEQIVAVPAWIRNKAELSKVEVRATKASLKGEATEKSEAPAAQSGSLFDMPEE